MAQIFAQPLNLHDHNTFDGKTHIQYERYPVSYRRKHCHWRIKYNQKNPEHLRMLDQQIPFQNMYNELFDQNADSETILAMNHTLNGLKLYGADRFIEKFDEFGKDTIGFNPKNLWDYQAQGNVYYTDHHLAHAAHTFLSSGYEESDIFIIDGGGNMFRSIFVDSKKQEVVDLSDHLPLGWLWNVMTKIGDFGVLQEGKLMGLVGYGKFDIRWYEIFNLMFEEFWKQAGKYWPDHPYFESFMKNDSWKVDMAHTLQQFTLDKIEEIVLPLKTSNNLCVAGGVAYNGYMNEMLTKHWDNVYVPCAPGDEGQSIGLYMHANYVINGEVDIPPIYMGDEYEVDPQIFEGLSAEEMDFDDICLVVAKEIANGATVGWHQGRAESGNRALGNRSILADPRDARIKDIINGRIKMREDFRPFAPSVLVEHYQDYFDTNQPSPFMSRIMPVKEDKKEIIPGVTHVDGTARIQTVDKETNERYYKVIDAFYKETGVPMLVNTSFNCQEPVVETPKNAVDTFKRTGLDILVVGNWLVRKWKK